MRSAITIGLMFLFLSSRAQDSPDLVKKQFFVDSLCKNQYLIIECFYSTCYYHKKYIVKVFKTLNNYTAEIKTISRQKGYKPKTVNLKPLSSLTRSQIDSIRKFEGYLNLYTTGYGDSQKSYSYTLTLGKKQKYYLDGMQTDPWMKIEGLVKILFPHLKQD